MQKKMRYGRIIMLEWRGILTVMNVLLLFFLLSLYKNSFIITSYNNISHINNTLLEHERFAERIAYKRRLSIADATTNFLACITEPTPHEANLKVISDPRLHPKLDIYFQNQLFSCMSLHIPIEIYELEAFKGINIEHKRFLPMDKAYYNDPNKKCLYLTLGIGNHTLSEEEFLQLYPKCQMFGVEISPYNVGNFPTFGKVLNVGVGFNQTLQILGEYVDYKGEKSYNLTLKPFQNILVEDIGSTLIHYATLDIDGFEYDMMERFEDFGLYESYGIVLCQIDIEVHFFRPDLSKFLLEFFHKASSYLPVYAGPYGKDSPAIKMTMINVKKPECELAFHISKYFQR